MSLDDDEEKEEEEEEEEASEEEETTEPSLEERPTDENPAEPDQTSAEAGVAAESTLLDPSLQLNDDFVLPTFHTGDFWKLGEEFMTFQDFQDAMAEKNLLGSRYMDSVFDTYVKRVVHMLFQSARPKFKRSKEKYQMLSLNFIVEYGKKHQIHFLGTREVVSWD